ncbi:MAG: riboflavin synthase subunit alpha [Candidatus Margulisbacteria bacterium GWF2_35_9]|nr:MAG: riboflavin synthase subunit alpha [Candidatus Margulisbacteria bacterium GWF2_35_9]
MFTGIIQEIGAIRALKKSSDSMELTIECLQLSKESSRGDSISVNGICLTIKEIGQNYFKMDVMKETLDRSNLKYIKSGDKVNLEKAVTPTSLMGGHFVQGHVDVVGIIESIQKTPQYWMLHIKPESDIIKFLIPKASIAINGISLTIVDVNTPSFSVSIIPTTYQDTNIGLLKSGNYVNLEVDMMGKYVYHYVQQMSVGKPKLTKETLLKNGF